MVNALTTTSTSVTATVTVTTVKLATAAVAEGLQPISVPSGTNLSWASWTNNALLNDYKFVNVVNFQGTTSLLRFFSIYL